MNTHHLQHPAIPHSIVIWQIVYSLIAISYNLFSAMVIPLAPTNPIAGSIFVAAYGLSSLVALPGCRILYRVLMVAFVSFLFVSGIGLHLKNFIQNPESPPGYASAGTLGLAVFINILGVGLGTIGILKTFETARVAK